MHTKATVSANSVNQGNRHYITKGTILIIGMLLVILFTHLVFTNSIPAGLYIDETSIGYNAALISSTGADEYGNRLPIYFKSVGDYKNAPFIYATAIIFKLFGVSEFNLRLTSFIFFGIALAFTYILTIQIFPNSNPIKIYLLLSFGFLPSFFTVSRIAFEVITQLSWISGFLLLIWNNFHQENASKYENLKAIACGIVLGTSIYTYSTARLLTFLTFFAMWGIYISKNNLRKLVLISSAFLVGLLPFIMFIVRQPGAITSRFSKLTYVNALIPIQEKFSIFIQNYLTYLSPNYLLLHGDSNFRHATGHGGAIYFSVSVLFFAGLAQVAFKEKSRQFYFFLLINLIFSPIAASLTSEGAPHSLRSILLGYYVLLISCYGLYRISKIQHQTVRRYLLIGITILFAIEVINYQIDYFFNYPARSIDAMASFGFKESLQFALDQKPDKIIFLNEPYVTYPNILFYSLLVSNPNKIQITANDDPKYEPGTCIIYHQSNESLTLQSSFPYTEYKYIKTDSEPIWGRKGAELQGVIKVKCYHPR